MTPEGALIIAEQVARAVIPDLSGRPLYLLQPSAASMITREQTECRLGFYFRNLDLALQPELERSGRWQGRGVAIVIDALMCFVLASDDDEGLRKVVGCVLHELCHWADCPEPAVVPTAPFADWLAAGERRKQRELEPQEYPPALIGHDFDFARLCCHVWYRSRLRGGCLIRPQHLSFGSDYPGLEVLPTPMECIHALNDELELLDGVRLRTVAKIAPPVTYTQYWDTALVRLFPTAESAA